MITPPIRTIRLSEPTLSSYSVPRGYNGGRRNEIAGGGSTARNTKGSLQPGASPGRQRPNQNRKAQETAQQARRAEYLREVGREEIA